MEVCSQSVNEHLVTESASTKCSQTLGQALLTGTEGEQHYIHSVLQHITTSAAEKHRKRKQRRRSSSKKRRHRGDKKSKKRRRSGEDSKTSSSAEEEEGAKEWKRRRKEAGESMSPLLKMVMTDLSRGFFESVGGPQAKKREGGLPQGLGLGEGLALGGTASSSSSTTSSATFRPSVSYPAEALTQQARAPVPQQSVPARPPLAPSSLLEPPRFPLVSEDRRLPLPLPMMQHVAAHRQPVMMPLPPQAFLFHRPAQQLPPQRGVDVHQAHSLPLPLHHLQHQHPSLSQEWSSADPPSDGDLGSPDTRMQHLPSLMAEIQSAGHVWRPQPILPPPNPAFHLLRSGTLPSWPSLAMPPSLPQLPHSTHSRQTEGVPF